MVHWGMEKLTSEQKAALLRKYRNDLENDEEKRKATIKERITLQEKMAEESSALEKKIQAPLPEGEIIVDEDELPSPYGRNPEDIVIEPRRDYDIERK